MMQEPATTYLTPEGKLKLEAELEDLKTNKRRELAERLNFAIKQGDLSENADYIMAKEDQAFLEGRIRTIEGMLRHVTIIQDRAAAKCASVRASKCKRSVRTMKSRSASSARRKPIRWKARSAMKAHWAPRCWASTLATN